MRNKINWRYNTDLYDKIATAKNLNDLITEIDKEYKTKYIRHHDSFLNLCNKYFPSLKEKLDTLKSKSAEKINWCENRYLYQKILYSDNLENLITEIDKEYKVNYSNYPNSFLSLCHKHFPSLKDKLDDLKKHSNLSNFSKVPWGEIFNKDGIKEVLSKENCTIYDIAYKIDAMYGTDYKKNLRQLNRQLSQYGIKVTGAKSTKIDWNSEGVKRILSDKKYKTIYEVAREIDNLFGTKTLCFPRRLVTKINKNYPNSKWARIDWESDVKEIVKNAESIKEVAEIVDSIYATKYRRSLRSLNHKLLFLPEYKRLYKKEIKEKYLTDIPKPKNKIKTKKISKNIPYDVSLIDIMLLEKEKLCDLLKPYGFEMADIITLKIDTLRKNGGLLKLTRNPPAEDIEIWVKEKIKELKKELKNEA